MKNDIINNYSLYITNEKTEIKGITGVSHYSDRELCFQIGKNSLAISGVKLNMENLNVDGGLAVISGEVHTVKYKKGASMLKKLSK